MSIDLEEQIKLTIYDSGIASESLSELVEGLTYLQDCNKIFGLQTFSVRSKVAGLIQELIDCTVEIDAEITRIDEYLKINEENREHDNDGIIGNNIDVDNVNYETPRRAQQHHKESLEEARDYLHKLVCGMINSFHIRFQTDYLTVCTYTKDGKMWESHKKYANNAQADSYRAVILGTKSYNDVTRRSDVLVRKISGIVASSRERMSQPVQKASQKELTLYQAYYKKDDELQQLKKKQYANGEPKDKKLIKHASGLYVTKNLKF